MAARAGAAEANYLAEPAELAILTGMADTDPLLLLALKRASDRFRGEVHHPVHFVSDDVEYRNGDGSTRMLVKVAPIVGTPSIKIGGAPITGVEVDRDSGILGRAAGWPRGLGNIEVTYSHGYEEIPGDIVDAVLEQAETQALALGGGLSQMTVGSQSASFGAQATVGVTQRWADTVQKYVLGSGERS